MIEWFDDLALGMRFKTREVTVTTIATTAVEKCIERVGFDRERCRSLCRSRPFPFLHASSMSYAPGLPPPAPLPRPQ